MVIPLELMNGLGKGRTLGLDSVLDGVLEQAVDPPAHTVQSNVEQGVLVRYRVEGLKLRDSLGRGYCSREDTMPCWIPGKQNCDFRTSRASLAALLLSWSLVTLGMQVGNSGDTRAGGVYQPCLIGGSSCVIQPFL